MKGHVSKGFPPQAFTKSAKIGVSLHHESCCVKYELQPQGRRSFIGLTALGRLRHILCILLAFRRRR